MIEYLKHIGTVGKILWGLVVFIVTSTASVFFFISSEVKALESKVLSLRDQDMSMIRSNLEDIKTDAHYTRQSVDELKKYLMERKP